MSDTLDAWLKEWRAYSPLNSIGALEFQRALKPLGSGIGWIWQGVNFPWRLIGGHLARADSTPVSALAKGKGSVVQVGGDKVAVYKDDQGTVHAVSPVCTHLSCIVELEQR